MINNSTVERNVTTYIDIPEFTPMVFQLDTLLEQYPREMIQFMQFLIAFFGEVCKTSLVQMINRIELKEDGATYLPD